jgi:protein-tyrosine phosphatase
VTDLRAGYAPEVRAIMSDAAPSYIEAALDSAEERYGSLDAYVRDGLELEPRVVSALRESLLERE